MEKQQLFVNDGPTAQTVNLTGCWRDVQGELHTGSFVLPAYSSVVLVKEDDATCISTGVDEDAPLPADDSFVYPNPATAGTGLQMNTEINSPWSLTAFNMEGQLVWSVNGAAGRRTVNVPEGWTRAPTFWWCRAMKGR
ncbi:MAG: hypothetical protein IPN85_00040 [Flavobacteriales bacterium]|nr:hypothetical protein [Flavobacteriales bacterium]